MRHRPEPFLVAAAKAMGLDELRVVDTGLDPVTAEREQWDDGNNTLALAPGLVVAYERNVVTNQALEAAGIEVVRIAGSELGSGRGGPRCMSCPVLRDPPAEPLRPGDRRGVCMNTHTWSCAPSTAAALLGVAAVHLAIAGDYTGIGKHPLSLGDQFYVQSVVAIVLGLVLLVRPHLLVWLATAGFAAGSLAVLVYSRYKTIPVLRASHPGSWRPGTPAARSSPPSSRQRHSCPRPPAPRWA